MMIPLKTSVSPRSYRVLSAPASGESLRYDVRSYTHALRPINKQFSFTESGDVSVRPLVSVLLMLSGPATVIWFVVAVIVDSVQRVFARRFATHVRNKIFYGDAPPVADGYPSAAVVFVVFISRFVAPIKHAVIGYVLRCKLTASCKSVRGLCFGSVFFVQAPAGLRSVRGNSVCADYATVAAGTETNPHGSPTSVWGAGYYSKAVELLTSNVNKFRHFRHLENFTIEKAWQAVVKLLFGSYPSHTKHCTGAAA